MPRPTWQPRAWILPFVLAAFVVVPGNDGSARPRAAEVEEHPNQVLEWNQIFIDTLIATNTANSSSQRLGATVHTAIFDAYNGIEQRYTHVFVPPDALPGASRRAAVIAAAHATLVGLFPSRTGALNSSYEASIAALSDDDGDGGQSRERGLAWGREVAQAVLAWRSADGFPGSHPQFFGGQTTGQWRPTPPNFGPMSGQGLSFTAPFVVPSSVYFAPSPPRTLLSSDYADDFEAVKALGRNTGSTRTADQSALAIFWEGNASVHWNQAANQIARNNQVSISHSNRLLALLNIAMADAAITTWTAKLFYGGNPLEVTWRPVSAIPLADTDGNPDTTADAGWLPLVTTPSHPEYPAGHPSLNGAAARALLDYFADAQTFRLTTTNQPDRLYTSITQAREDGNNGRVWGGMHFPTTVVISDEMGARIAAYVNANAMQRAHPPLIETRN
jgi:hypothetical protein